MTNIEEDGVPLSHLIDREIEAVNFYCRTCHRTVSKPPEELLELATAETGLWALTRRMRCTSCRARDFTARLGYPRGCTGIFRNGF